VSPYKLKKRRSHQNCSEWQTESYGKCQFLQKLGSRLISHYSFGRKESRFLFIPSKNLRYSIQGTIHISKTTASRSCCERSIPDSYYRQRHRNTARKISLRYELHSYYHQRPAGCNTAKPTAPALCLAARLQVHIRWIQPSAADMHSINECRAGGDSSRRQQHQEQQRQQQKKRRRTRRRSPV
jgi:hypothetical protein